MEGSALNSGLSKQLPTRKLSSSNPKKDLWSITREGSLHELDSALMFLKKNGGSIDARNMFGLTPLHIATWRNHVPIVRRLLAAGADPDARDGESGWSSLHRALHFGHLAVAGVLLQSGASLTLEDSKYRTPIDLLSGPVAQILADGNNSVATEAFSWGSGANYQLGTGNARIQKLPCKVDELQGADTKIVAAAKFHSVAVGANGELYTWGFGRGGRLGHPDFDIHSGQAAVITPRQVHSGLWPRHVKSVAAAKHHTVIATEGGEVFTWGSNREGQLGYTSVDTQPTPRRVSSLRTKIIAVAAANKHTAVVSENGEVFTWGCNKEGQLGYGTSNSASNYTPRVVEYLKGKVFVGVSAAKYHTVVLGSDGEVFTWGHRLVNPTRVVIARNTKKSGSAPLKFHRKERVHVVSVAAGVIHSTVLTDDGALFYWLSSDPELKCQQLYSMRGRNFVSISVGKYWTAAVTTTGDVYMWDGKKYKDETPIPTRLHGIKRATSVSVGETHLLIICALYHPVYPPKLVENPQKKRLEVCEELEELDEDFMFNDSQMDKTVSVTEKDNFEKLVPSLKSLCQEVAAEFLVEPRNAIQLLEVADALEANDLRMHCEDIAIRNLDFIFAVSASAVVSASPEILAKLEKSLDARSSEPWSHRRLPTPTATFPAIIDSEEDSETGYLRPRDSHAYPVMKTHGDLRVGDGFLQPKSAADEVIFKQIRALRKKLQQIEMLEAKQASGHLLDGQQIAKLQTRLSLETQLAELGGSLESEEKNSLPNLADGKGSKKGEVSRKQRKIKQKSAPAEAMSGNYEMDIEPNSIKGFPDVKGPTVYKEKEVTDVEETGDNEIVKEKPAFSKGEIPPSHSNNSGPTSCKKKNKKGGLSMFLSGALDDTPRDPAPPPTPKTEGPAWGGIKISKGPTSLRDIQNEQSKTKEIPSVSRGKDRAEEINKAGNDGQIRLGSFLPGAVSSPVPVVPGRVPSGTEGEKSTPPWVAAGTSPVQCRPSLRDIQIQQEKKQQTLSHSPKTRSLGFAVSSGQGSPSESSCYTPKDPVPSRWFKPEADSPSSIRSIQIEEKAIKDLKRFYTSVKVVKNQP